MAEKKVLVFGITENPGGIESVIMNYYRHINRDKIQFDFLCNTKTVAYESEILSLGGKIYRITARAKDRKKFYEELDAFFSCHANEYGSIWVNVCSLANIDYLKYAKKYGIPKRIIHSHNSMNMDSKLRGLLHHVNRLRIDRYATDFWACSSVAAKWFFTNRLMSNKEILIINNAIDTSCFKFDQKTRNLVRSKMGIEDKLVIGHVGRFHFQKNQAFLIDIFENIYKNNNNAVLLLVGDGEDREKIESLVTEKGLSDVVCFLGLRDDVSQLMQAFDLFVFPSLFEGLPLVLMEAQCASLPTFTSLDKVTKDVKVSEYLDFISLDCSGNEWAHRILNHPLLKMERTMNIEGIIKSGYDIETETKKIEKKLIV